MACLGALPCMGRVVWGLRLQFGFRPVLLTDTPCRCVCDNLGLLCACATAPVQLKKDESGCIFVDRDGRHFHDILK